MSCCGESTDFAGILFDVFIPGFAGVPFSKEGGGALYEMAIGYGNGICFV